MNDALRDWVTNVRDTFYCIGTVAGPHPYPAMVRDFQTIIGKEVREQMRRPRGGCPTRWSRPSAGARTPSGSSIPFLDDPRCGSSAWRPGARA
jgi:tryptophan synthase beta chain